MSVSIYFNNTNSIKEQKLFDGMAAELIRQKGVDTYYLPRTPGNMDDLYSEDATSSFNRAFLIEMYIKDSYKGFAGLGDLVSNAGPEITDQITLVVSRTTFITEIGEYFNNQPRPNEGDLVFLKGLNNKAFRITFVEHESVFYNKGALYVWELKCELFSYGGEIFNTGIPEIDSMTDNFDPNILGLGLILENISESSLAIEQDNLPLFTEEYEEENVPNKLFEINDWLQEKGKQVIDFSEWNPESGTAEY